MLLENAVCLEARLAPELRTVSRLTAAPELAVLGVLSTGIGFTLQIIAQRATSPTEAAIVTSTESLFGAAAATALLGENVTLSAGVGATLIYGDGPGPATPALVRAVCCRSPGGLYGDRRQRRDAAVDHTIIGAEDTISGRISKAPGLVRRDRSIPAR